MKEKRKPEPLPEPGQYDAHLKPFGSGLSHSATMGSKYIFKPDSNPPVGAYNIDSAKELVSSRSKAALIKEEVSPYRRPKEQSPDPGQYDSHLKPFGSELKHSASMGSKYVFKPDSNPPVGAYNIDSAKELVSSRSQAAVIKEEVSPYRRPKEQSPDPGQYDSHLKPFGSDVKGNPGMGSKYVFKPDSNPPVGGYDVERGESALKFNNRSTTIREDVIK